MLKTILNKFVLAPVLVTGVFISNANAQRPNITALTSDKTATQEAASMPESSPRIPGDLNKHYLGIGFGETFVYGDFRRNGMSKITIPELYYTYTATHSFDFVANLHYSKHSYKSHYAQLPGLALSIKAKIFQFDAFSPFVLGGLGFYMPVVKYTNAQGALERSEARMVLGLNLGAGAELRLNDEVNIGVIAHYHRPFDVRQENVGDVSGGYMKLMITASYAFN